MIKPIIAITPMYDVHKRRYYMTEAMLQCIWDNGGIPLPLPLTDTFHKEDYSALLNGVDGIVFTGGWDFPATFYGEENSEYLSPFAPPRDVLEFGLMPMVLDMDLPILAICRGMQLGNVVLGGNLYQDLPRMFESKLNHELRVKENYELLAHTISATEQGEDVAQAIFGATEFSVNSLHHQGIKRLADPLVPLVASEDGLIEGYYHPRHRFFLGVQWHPEYLYKGEKSSLRTLEALVEAAGLYKEQKEQ